MKKWIHYVLSVSVLLVFASFFGCQKPKPKDPACTASSETAPDCTPRGWSEKTASYQNSDVKHLSLYMKNCMEIQGSNKDGWFRTWDLYDLCGEFYCPADFFAQILLLPVSAVIAPPCKSQYSRSVFDQQEPVYELPAAISGQAANNPW